MQKYYLYLEAQEWFGSTTCSIRLCCKHLCSSLPRAYDTRGRWKGCNRRPFHFLNFNFWLLEWPGLEKAGSRVTISHVLHATPAALFQHLNNKSRPRHAAFGRNFSALSSHKILENNTVFRELLSFWRSCIFSFFSHVPSLFFFWLVFSTAEFLSSCASSWLSAFHLLVLFTILYLNIFRIKNPYK